MHSVTTREFAAGGANPTGGDGVPFECRDYSDRRPQFYIGTLLQFAYGHRTDERVCTRNHQLLHQLPPLAITIRGSILCLPRAVGANGGIIRGREDRLGRYRECRDGNERGEKLHTQRHAETRPTGWNCQVRAASVARSSERARVALTVTTNYDSQNKPSEAGFP